MKQLLTEHIPFTVDKILVEQSIKEQVLKTIMVEYMNKKYLKEKLKNILMARLKKREL